MIIVEEKGKDLFRFNKAGEVHLNIYKGCEEVCPFCYWQADPMWLNHLYVNIDAADRLEKEIDNISHGQTIRLGYGPLESKYHLTRKCLEILIKKGYPLIISSGWDNILSDLEILKKGEVSVIMEFTKFKEMDEFNSTGTNKYFETANTLKKNGIDVRVTVSPILPGITNVEKIAHALPEIPIHISLLDVRPNTMWGEATLEYVNQHYPSLYPLYTEIQRTGSDPYYQSLYEKYKDDKGQIKTYLPFLDHRPKDGEEIKR